MAHVKTNSTGTYSVLWREKQPDGSTKFKQKTFKAKRAAERFARNTEVALDKGDAVDPRPHKAPTLGVLVEQSLAASKATLKPSTYKGYRLTYDNHIVPELGAKPITALTPEDVEKWVQGLADKGLSPATIRNTFVALTKVCKYAIRHGHIRSNPCTGTPLPKHSHVSDEFTGQVLTAEEIDTLTASIAYPGDLLLRFLCLTGLRAGELAGLQIADLDLLHGTVHVRRTVQRIKGEGWVATAPKTKRSRREVPILSSGLKDDLQAFLDVHPNRANPEAPLWPGRKPGTHAVDFTRRLDPTNFLRWYLRPALEAAGLPKTFRLHDCRHTAASLWLAAGIPPYKVSRWLGHSSIAVTDSVYSHLYPSDYSAERALLDAHLKPKPRKGRAPVRRLAR